jgi:predicted enzyme related to lactoylglutathione lyase
MKILGSDMVSYEVSDIGRAVAFYRDVLGLAADTRLIGSGWVELDAPPTTLVLYSPTIDANRRPEVGGGMIWLAVPDVGAALDELRGQGVAVVMGPLDTPVCHVGIVRDPDGNKVGLHRRKDGTVG